MTKNTILVINNDDITTKWLISFLSINNYDVQAVGTGREGLAKMAAEQPDLVILDLKLSDISGELVIESVVQNPKISGIPIVVLLEKDDPQEIAHLFDKGIADFIVKKPGIEAKLLSVCRACLSRAKRTNIQRSSGRLISFISAKGGNGTSTLCLNLAHMLARQVAPKTILVVDMVLPLGSLAIMTGSHQDKSIAELTTEGEPYNHLKLKNYLVPVESWNFSIIEGSRKPQDAGKLNPDQIYPIFHSLLSVYNYVIVDLGKTLSRVSLPVLQDSDSIVIVLGPDPVTVELTQTALNFLEETGIQKDALFLILNRAVGREGLTKNEIENSFKLPIKGTVPYSQDNFNLATNQNSPYANRFPQDGSTFIINDLAAMLLKQVTNIHDMKNK